MSASRARSTPRNLTLVVAAGFTLVAGLLTWFSIVAADGLSSHTVHGPDLRPLVLCLGLVGLTVSTYVAWPSRWNVLAHTNLVFALVAYVIPIFALHRLDGLSSFALDTYYRVIAVGFVACILGTLVGASLASPQLAERIRTSRRLEGYAGRIIERRVLLLTAGCTVAVVLCFAYMRFVPAFASDPLLAKFFKGPYAVRYARVSVPYRFGTSVISLLLPLAAYFGLRRRASTWWRLTFALATAVLLLGLLRQPAVAGTLILIGAALAVRGRGLPLYFSLLIAAYVSGAALYALFSAIGLSGFSATTGGGALGDSFLAQVSVGAPDLNDQLTFLGSWLPHPTYTDGRTFIGGLVPSNYRWNPAVWALQVENPGVPIKEIGSGGLRLPAPIWGLVSFGWPGVIGVSFFNGVTSGFLARLFSRIVPSRSLAVATCWLVLYVALTNVVPLFYGLTYFGVIQLGVIMWVLLWRTRTPPGWQGDVEPDHGSGSATTQARSHLGDGVAPARTGIGARRGR